MNPKMKLTRPMCLSWQTPKVTTEPHDDDSEISKELLLQAFFELSESFDLIEVQPAHKIQNYRT